MAASLSSSLPSACCCFHFHGDDSTKSVMVHSLAVGKSRFRHPLRRMSSSVVVVAATQGSRNSEESSVPAWARPDSDEPPPWASNEGGGASNSPDGFQIPFYVYLLASTVTAIAAIGSVFEYVNKNPVFGVLSSDSIFYAPLLGFFAFTGIPTSAYLWFKSVQAANKEADEQDRKDGFL